MKPMNFVTTLAILLAFWFSNSIAATSVETFEIEGLITPASPKALTSELESRLGVKVIGLNLKNTASGWPMMSIEMDSAKLSREDIEKAIADIEDPAGHNYRVHKGSAFNNAPYTEEETTAMARFGPAAPEIPDVTNPIEGNDDSLSRGKQTYGKYCATCHGLNGNGYGPAAHGITTFPRQLWTWNNTGAATDGYLFWFITNGRNEMPPWGLLLSENNRWDVINYIKSLKKPD